MTHMCVIRSFLWGLPGPPIGASDTNRQALRVLDVVERMPDAALRVRAAHPIVKAGPV